MSLQDVGESLNLSLDTEDGWKGLSIKDEITDLEDNIDIWASTMDIFKSMEENMKSNSISLPQPIPTTAQIKPEKYRTVKPEGDRSSSRSEIKSEASRKRTWRIGSEDTPGNPDSGKENTDQENLSSGSRTSSPSTKKKKSYPFTSHSSYPSGSTDKPSDKRSPSKPDFVSEKRKFSESLPERKGKIKLIEPSTIDPERKDVETKPKHGRARAPKLNPSKESVSSKARSKPISKPPPPSKISSKQDKLAKFLDREYERELNKGKPCKK